MGLSTGLWPGDDLKRGGFDRDNEEESRSPLRCKSSSNYVLGAQTADSSWNLGGNPSMETRLGGGQHADGIFKLRLRTLALAIGERVQRLGLGGLQLLQVGEMQGSGNTDIEGTSGEGEEPTECSDQTERGECFQKEESVPLRDQVR